MRLLAFFLFVCLVNLAAALPVKAAGSINCPNRFVTLINPVRSRQLWTDQTLQPLLDQYQLINRYNFPATWLLQYDTLSDTRLLDEVKKFDRRQETGVLLEVSKNLAGQAGVVYPADTIWYKPQAVFLSGYTQSERRRLIDHLMSGFKKAFGLYPSSVGAWWIDSYSLGYLRTRYGIKSALIVADQKLTDNYGIWGQWWGMPYYPDKANILVPASGSGNKQDVVVLQWAQRGGEAAVGNEGWRSLYSLQANDYLKMGKDISYFSGVATSYLDCRNSVGQITVGLETGMESVGMGKEYERQLQWLKSVSGLRAVTMSRFADVFAKVYPGIPQANTLRFSDLHVNLNSQNRIIKENGHLLEKIDYFSGMAFPDYFLADKAGFLDRRLNTFNTRTHFHMDWPWLWIVAVLTGILAVVHRRFTLWIYTLFFCWAAFGLVFRSGYQYGWEVFYGPVLPEITVWQVGLFCVVLLVLLETSRKIEHKIKDWNLLLALLFLSYGVDSVLQQIRFSLISGKFLLGFSPDSVNFSGLTFSRVEGLGFINKPFSPQQLAAFLKINFESVYSNGYWYLVFLPLLHLLLASILFVLLKRASRNTRHVSLAVLAMLFLLELQVIFSADPKYI